jgi:hypothetical protein
MARAILVVFLLSFAWLRTTPAHSGSNWSKSRAQCQHYATNGPSSPNRAWPNPFTVKPNPYGARLNSFTVKPNPFGARPNPFTVKPNPFGARPNPFTVKPMPKPYGLRSATRGFQNA